MSKRTNKIDDIRKSRNVNGQDTFMQERGQHMGKKQQIGSNLCNKNLRRGHSADDVMIDILHTCILNVYLRLFHT